MNYRYFASFLLLLAICILPGLVPAGGHTVSSCMSDLDGDGTMEVLSLEGGDGNEYADFLCVRSGGKELCRSGLKALKPWKVQTADVDGDGKTEISIGVFKTAKFDPVPAKRPFIYNWNNGGLSPKWLGSRLSRPFDDYIFSDIDRDGMDELISVEHLADGQRAINSYKWKGFGFEGMCESRGFQDIDELSAKVAKGTEAPVLKVRIKEENKWRYVYLKYEYGKFSMS